MSADRRAYWRAYYRANREKKLASANARNHRLAAERKAAKKRRIRFYARAHD